MMRGEEEFNQETELYKKHKRLDDRKCGVCDGKAELGPFCGGPFPYYCKDCHKKFMRIMEAYHHHLEVTGFAVYHKRGFFKKTVPAKQTRSEIKTE